jgi:hypothetical protein
MTSRTPNVVRFHFEVRLDPPGFARSLPKLPCGRESNLQSKSHRLVNANRALEQPAQNPLVPLRTAVRGALRASVAAQSAYGIGTIVNHF